MKTPVELIAERTAAAIAELLQLGKPVPKHCDVAALPEPGPRPGTWACGGCQKVFEWPPKESR